ncbi:hypothetical protein [Fodinicola feengrottensis]|uniref:hypothetical protein n=1 Tax=Fodinicola feengrottensis TaxID=435914 RepID=UPI0013D37EF9|nr:hypothetical protein [Fodinicola feengrottensis]
MAELDRVVEHEGKIRDRDLQTQLRDDRRQLSTEMSDVADTITAMQETHVSRADMQQTINQAVAEAVAPYQAKIAQQEAKIAQQDARIGQFDSQLRHESQTRQHAITELASQAATERSERQSADGHLQADVSRVEADLSERVEDTQVATNDVTRGLNDLNERHDTLYGRQTRTRPGWTTCTRTSTANIS